MLHGVFPGENGCDVAYFLFAVDMIVGIVFLLGMEIVQKWARIKQIVGFGMRMENNLSGDGI